jgi:spectinomycin phosphotransferase/16S rRNA (guanine(1405)-N(7))-methyltransferase
VFTRPDDLSDSQVADALAQAWRLRVDKIDYAPVGFGSHHWWVTVGEQRWFVTVDDLEAKRRHLGEALTEPLKRLSAALATACSLRDGGMTFVIAPLRTDRGRIVHSLGERFAMAVYPHVEGETHEWGPYPTRAARLAVLDLVAAVHGAPEAIRRAALVDDLAIPSRDQLEDALAELTEPWVSGPFAEPARALLGSHADTVQHALDHYDRRALAVAARPERMVLTHGEPHCGNTIDTADGVVLIDWDTALVAPPERDLWALAEQDAEILHQYAERTGVTPDPDAVTLYSLGWDLTDISLYIAGFRQSHLATDDTRAAWRNLGHALDPARWAPVL